jgi:hypothetical protein
MRRQLFRILRTTMVADAQLDALLGGTAEQRIFRDQTKGEPDYPYLRIWFVSDGKDNLNSGTGVFRPTLQIDIFHTDAVVGDQIVERLDALFDIPRTNAAGLAMTNYRCDNMIRSSDLLRFPSVRQGETSVVQIVTEWRGHVVPV